MIDGARASLSGYLYQFLGVAGLAARARDSDGSKKAGSAGSAIASSIGSISHEEFDMDAVVRISGTNDAEGVQFKHSQSRRKITPGELIQILDAFHRSSTRLQSLTFTQYVLITNRSFGPGAEKLYKSRVKSTSDSKLSSKVPGKDPLYESEDQAAASRHAILQKFRMDPPMTGDDWNGEVREYACRHGVLPDEFDQGLSRLIGEILQRTTAGSLELDSEFLKNCLLGAPDARSLAVGDGSDSARAAAGEDLETFISEKLVDKEETLIRRRLIEEVEKQVSMHSLVFVVSQGGSGKSVLAAQYLRNESATRFVAAETAIQLADDWPGHRLRVWRSPGHFRDLRIEPIDRVVDRLCHANPRAPRPILVLDLDGIDEIPLKDRLTVWRLIDRFRRLGSEPASAVLLVTARIRGTNQDECAGSA